ncbi:hypothetical protein SY88_18600 [Clostridiales bacterium PH28_bin88]|nr:hypothetical protein SY88_18600 [Clostridiales bacterium PH28_bin88]
MTEIPPNSFRHHLLKFRFQRFGLGPKHIIHIRKNYQSAILPSLKNDYDKGIVKQFAYLARLLRLVLWARKGVKYAVPIAMSVTAPCIAQPGATIVILAVDDGDTSQVVATTSFLRL